jgi:hypothetical protein
MSNSPNQLVLALLATLEEQAQKKGKKSVVKAVAAHLRKAGADEALVGEVEALGGGKPVAVAAPKAPRKARSKAEAKPANGTRAEA